MISVVNETEMEAIGRVENLVDEAAHQMMTNFADWTSNDIIQMSENELLEKVDLQDDEQSHCFVKLLATSTNFASSNFIQRIRLIPALVKSTQDLLDEMRNEVKECAEAANEFEELVHFFYNLVIDTKHNMGLVLPHLKATMKHIDVIVDALEPHDNKPLNDIDKKDITISIQDIVNRMQKMLELSHENSLKSRELNERILKLKKDLNVKSEVAKHRISLSNAFCLLLPLGTSTASVGTIGTMSGSVNFGGAGALVIAGASLNPIVAIIIAVVIGGLGVVGIASLIRHFWVKHQHRAVEYLQKICVQLVELHNANIYFLQCLHENKEAVNSMTVELDQIITLVTIDSERMRRRNAKLCQGAIEATEQTIECIEKIKKIDMSHWINPTNLIQYSDNRLFLPASDNE